ncbi:signal transduction histidine kinase [Murinocardiopsis flavida]|uniref:histidine kinase n=1 Tax=Murinocardiopsis flavida TaxID=645275 RepID=A0A2P8DE08_9ACTN|nr:histidine kinase [Murinocardiopsis flavida]PSK95463.1 signal transduction histidine kinase [Murinocardiopsis flavida]
MRRLRFGPGCDLAGAVFVIGVMLAATRISSDPPAPFPDAVVVVAVCVIGAWAAAARHAPRVALVGAFTCYFIAIAIGVPAFEPASAIGLQLFTAAAAGHLRWAVGALSLATAGEVPYRILGADAEPALQVLYETAVSAILLVVLVLLGEALRSRRALDEEAELRLCLAEQEFLQRTTAERLRAARDLHDVLAHTVTVVGIQASVAAESIDGHPERAKAAIASVRAANEDAMRDLRSTIAVLRERRGGGADVPLGVGQLHDLLDAVRATGMSAVLTLSGDMAALRPAVELTVYRVVQESLTNALRHSGAASVGVDVAVGDAAVRVTVRDDGPDPRVPDRPAHRAGSGLSGMAERVGVLGGELRYGAADDAGPGWSVRADIPLKGAS